MENRRKMLLPAGITNNSFSLNNPNTNTVISTMASKKEAFI